jgi:hypothetical protein
MPAAATPPSRRADICLLFVAMPPRAAIASAGARCQQKAQYINEVSDGARCHEDAPRRQFYAYAARQCRYAARR